MPDKIVNHFVLADGSVARYDFDGLVNAPFSIVDFAEQDFSPLSFEERIYHTTQGSGRDYLKHDFTEGKTYKLVVEFVRLKGSGTPFSFRTTETASNTTIVQEIYAEPSSMGGTVYDGKTFEWEFTVTGNANYLYCYASSSESQPIVDYTVKLYEQRDTVLDLLGQYTELTNEFDTTVTSGGAFCRQYYPKSLEVGKTYDIYYFVENWTNYGITGYFNQVGFNIRTALTADTSNIKETILNTLSPPINPGYGEENKLYHVEFTPTVASNYIYLYATAMPNTGTNNALLIVVEKDATILNKYDKAEIYKKISEVNDPQYSYYYDGERIKLTKNKFDCSLLMTESNGGVSTSYQGMAVFDNKIYQLFHGGYCNVYSLDTLSSTPVAQFQLGSFDTDNNHANNCNFGGYYNGNAIPLLYVTDGNSGEVIKCSVENIVVSNGSYTSSTVQTITLDQSGFANAGLVPYWGWSSWFADAENDLLYYFGAKYRTNGSEDAHYNDNKYIITTFRLPELTNATVILTASDVLDQFTTIYDVNVTQGGTLFDRKIFYTFGFGSSAYPSAVRVYDIAEKSLANQIDLSFITEELEACAVWDGKLLVNTQAGKIYQLKF